MLEQRLNELKDLKGLVNCRDELAKGTTASDSLRQWHERLKQALDGLTTSEGSLVRRLDEIRIDQDSLYDRKADSDDKTAALKPWLDLQSKQLDQLADTCEASLLHLRANERSLWRLESQLAAIFHAEIRANPWAAAWQWCTSWWDYPLAKVDDNSWVTLGSIVKGILFSLASVLLARLTSRGFGRHVLGRFGLNPGAVVAIQSMSFYVFCCLFSFEALQLAGLPLATFTFLGGAAAIGIGFGSQNVLNNFISGLILLAEQPIRVGDMVEIEGIRGTIERIGARSTRMRTLANHEIMVPNSQLLQDKVTNLTLSDDLVRACIEVKLGADMGDRGSDAPAVFRGQKSSQGDAQPRAGRAAVGFQLERHDVRIAFLDQAGELDRIAAGRKPGADRGLRGLARHRRPGHAGPASARAGGQGYVAAGPGSGRRSGGPGHDAKGGACQAPSCHRCRPRRLADQPRSQSGLSLSRACGGRCSLRGAAVERSPPCPGKMVSCDRRALSASIRRPARRARRHVTAPTTSHACRSAPLRGRRPQVRRLACGWPAGRGGRDHLRPGARLRLFGLRRSQFVFQCRQVRGGLAGESIRWAFTGGPSGEWYPLSMMSHMLDVELFGLDAWGHHLTSVVLHAATVDRAVSGLAANDQRLWPSTAVAALFAVHPQHVESVAWISERRDVLSGLFFVLTLAAYLGYVRHGGVGGMLLVAVLLSLGLMSKAMLVTVPALLLLLDFWPLGRFGQAAELPDWAAATPQRSFGRLVLEKLPLFGIALADCAATLLTHAENPVAVSRSWSGVIANAVVSPVAYLGQFFYPVDLAIFYPLPAGGASGLAGARGAGGAGADHGGGGDLASAAAVSAGRLVLVFGNVVSGARDRHRFRPCHGRPLHVFA